jgi:NADPH-dependent 2,4-dienoyl-CoA reductase/sulfur reductase-like enzyme
VTATIVVVGAGLGALRLVEGLARLQVPADVTVFGAEPHPPYNRPPLSKAALSAANHSATTLAFPQRAAISGVRWRLETPIVEADLHRKVVTDLHGHRHCYDILVAATGLRARRLQTPDRSPSGSHAVRTIEDAERLRAALSPGRRVVIAGASFIGCEVAATARRLGCEVVLISSDPLPMQHHLGPMLAGAMLRRHRRAGVDVRTGRRVVGIDQDGPVVRIQLDDGTLLHGDLVVEAIGAQHNTEWLDGNDITGDGGILTDEWMRARRADGSAHPDVFAIGDVARFPNALYPDRARSIGHWNIPTETAKRAAHGIARALSGDPVPDTPPFAPVPSFWTDQYEVSLLSYGLPQLATDSVLIAGDPDGECVMLYFDGRRSLVGVCGIGHRSAVMGYRHQIGTHEADLTG